MLRRLNVELMSVTSSMIHKDLKLKCDHCENVYKKKSALKNHCNTKHSDIVQEFKRDQCDRSYPT